MNELSVLVLDGNLLELSNAESKSSNSSGPCLEILDLSSNIVERIGPNFLRAFSCGNVHSFYLGNSNVGHIDKGKVIKRFKRINLI